MNLSGNIMQMGNGVLSNIGIGCVFRKNMIFFERIVISLFSLFCIKFKLIGGDLSSYNC